MSTIELTEAVQAASVRVEEYLRRTTFASPQPDFMGGGGITASLPEVVGVALEAALPYIREALAQQVEALQFVDANIWIPDTMYGIEQASEVVRGICDD